MPSFKLRVTILILVIGTSRARILKSDSTELLLDGLIHGQDDDQFSSLGLNGSFSSSSSLSSMFLSMSSSSSSSKNCSHYYGFFPCADSIGGYIFQIVVYEFLLAAGERLLTKGSKVLFNIMGTGVFGPIFQILMVLPGIVLVLISGLSQSTAAAQSMVASAVGVYSGTTVFCITLQWGICVFFGRNKFSNPPSLPDSSSSSPSGPSIISQPLIAKEKTSILTGSGITTDKKTNYTAGIMLLSLIPFVIVQLTKFSESSSWNRSVIFVAFLVSVSGLVSYFVYQILHPWMQERSLEYTKYENLLAGFLQHVQRHARGKLVTEEGQPNIPVIKSLFAKIDKDGDQSVCLPELEALILDIQSGNVRVDRDYAVEEVLRTFDRDEDGTITEEEFVDGFAKWIHEAKKLAGNGDPNFRKPFAEVLQPWIKKRKQELTNIECLMARILKHFQNQTLEAEGLITDDGKPNLVRIKSLFDEVDTNKNKLISESELKKLIHSIKFGNEQLDPDVMVAKVMKDFDENGDHMISQQEFVDGVTKWVREASRVVNNYGDAKNLIDEFDKIKWKEVESLVYEVEHKEGIIKKLLSWGCLKSTVQVILGILMVTFLGGPLIYSILNLSAALGVPTFYIAFVIIPLSLNSKMTISAIFPASQKSLKTASLTFSEIYGGVVMNNIMGLSILLAIVYIKDLTWDYSVEVLVVLVVCSIIGLFAFFRTTYPLWTCILAFFLYPFSLVLVHFLHYGQGWD